MKFSEERALFATANTLPIPAPVRVERSADLRSHARRLKENGWPVFLIVACAVAVGWGATWMIPPVYEANLLIQVADAAGPSKSFVGEAANVFDIKTPATAEMEILRSRMIVAPIVEQTGLRIIVRPRYYVNFVRDAKMAVREFNAPASFDGEAFVATIEEEGRYTLRHPALPAAVEGVVGQSLVAPIGAGQLTLLVSELRGNKGAQFLVTRKPVSTAIVDLQDALKLSERGRQSGIIEVTLRDSDPARAADVLNAIGASYVNQAVVRKTSEADKALAFLNAELPALKQQMDRAESAYNRFRSGQGTVSFEDDARLALTRSYALKTRLTDAQQKRGELMTTTGSAHPAVRAIDEQISAIEREIGGLQAQISAMPGTQQGAARLERDMKVSTDMYQQLRNNALQLQLARQGMTGNTRLIDTALVPSIPVRPKPALTMGIAAFGGAVLSVLFVLLRSGLARGVRSVREIEADTGLNVYSSSIPLARVRASDRRRAQEQRVLTPVPREVAVGLRQLRTLLQHQMRDRANNRVLITGPTEGVGVRFLVANLGATSALAGARILLIDADRRRGSLHRSFGMAMAPGLTELLSGGCTRQEAVRPTGIPRLDLISAGSTDIDFDEPAAARAFVELLDHASRDYNVVLIAAPPLLSSSETLTLALTGSMVVLVARARTTDIDDITESARRLLQVGLLPGGVVLNGV